LLVSLQTMLPIQNAITDTLYWKCPGCFGHATNLCVRGSKPATGTHSNYCTLLSEVIALHSLRMMIERQRACQFWIMRYSHSKVVTMQH